MTRRLEDLITHLILIFFVLVAVFPVAWILSTSFKPKDEVFSTEVHFIPQHPTLENYVYVLAQTAEERVGRTTRPVRLFERWARNSFVVAGATTVVGVFLAASAAYAASRFNFPGKRATMMSFLITQMFPGAILVVPLYNIFNELRILNSFPGLVLAYCTIALPFSVWMLKSFFDTIPIELEEAARIDGLSPLGTFWRIALPLTLPGIAVVGFFNFMTAWNEFMLALTFMTGELNKTLPVGLRNYVFQFATDWHYMSAGSILVTIPVLIGFTWTQRYLIAGLTSGGVKG